MARGQGWTIFFTLLLGILGTSLFWLYSPYLQDRVARQVAEELKGRQPALEAGKEGSPALAGGPQQAPGSRFQLVSDGKNVFLADLKEGRVWRYYHLTKESGAAKEDEGFLPLPVYYGGKKSYSASEPEETPGKP